MGRNADWTAEELILALDLYFRLPSTKASEHDPRVVELSRILQRKPAAVYMKMRNYLRFEGRKDRVGLSRGAKMEAAIWRGFSVDRPLLRRTAKSIIDRVKDNSSPQESFRL